MHLHTVFKLYCVSHCKFNALCKENEMQQKQRSPTRRFFMLEFLKIKLYSLKQIFVNVMKMSNPKTRHVRFRPLSGV